MYDVDLPYKKGCYLMDNPDVRRQPDHHSWHVIRVDIDTEDEYADGFYTLFGVLVELANRYPNGRVWISAYGTLNGLTSGSIGGRAHKTVSSNTRAHDTVQRATRIDRAMSQKGTSQIEKRIDQIFSEVEYYTVRYKER